MIRLNVLLLIAVIATALLLVHTQHRSRQLFTELYKEQGEARRLEADLDRLQVDKRAQATPLRVEKDPSGRLATSEAMRRHCASWSGLGSDLARNIGSCSGP